MPLLFLAYWLCLLSCNQQPHPVQKEKAMEGIAGQKAIIFYKVPEGMSLNLVYYDDFFQPVNVLLRGSKEIDSLIIDTQNYTFLDNQNAIYTIWSIIIYPGDRLFIEYTGDDTKFNSYQIKSLIDSNRTSELGFFSSYNNWRFENREHHTLINKRLAFWKAKNIMDSVFACQNLFLNERLAFLNEFRNRNQMSENTFKIITDNFYTGFFKAKFHTIRTMQSGDPDRRNMELDSLLKVLSMRVSERQTSFFNAHSLIVASMLMKEMLPSNATVQERVDIYSNIVNHSFSGEAKELLVLDLLIKIKAIDNLGDQLAKLKKLVRDSNNRHYLENELNQRAAIENLPEEYSYGITPNDRVVGLDSLLKSQKGKKILINFWASWCGPCLQELDDLIPALPSFNPDKVTLIFLSVDNSLSAWKYANESLGLTDYKYSYNLSGALNDKILKDYKIEGFPTNLLFSEKGELKKKITGAVSIEELKDFF